MTQTGARAKSAPMQSTTPEASTMTGVTFKGRRLPVTSIDGTLWMAGVHIGAALDLPDPAAAIRALYHRNRMFFTPGMTAGLQLPNGETRGRLTLLFSMRGAALLAALSASPHAEAFRSWAFARMKP